MTALFRAEPCPYMADGRLCARTDDRPLVLLSAEIGWGCLDHRPSLQPKEATE